MVRGKGKTRQMVRSVLATTSPKGARDDKALGFGR